MQRHSSRIRWSIPAQGSDKRIVVDQPLAHDREAWRKAMMRLSPKFYSLVT